MATHIFARPLPAVHDGNIAVGARAHRIADSPRTPGRSTLPAMCRSIRQLRRPEAAGSATTVEARAAALQYVRKISGFREPSARNEAAFRAAVDEIAEVTERLLAAVGTTVAEGPDPFADPVTRRAIIAARGTPTRRRATAGAAEPGA
jgi:hypothetical protein